MKKENKLTLPMKEISLMDIEYHYHIPVKVNGKKHWMVVDTGASRTVFDKDKFKGIKNKSQINSEPTIAAGDGSLISLNISTLSSLSIGKMSFKNIIAACIDCSQFNNIYRRFNQGEVIGIIGNDILKEAGALIDYKKKTITFRYNLKNIQTKIDKEVKLVKEKVKDGSLNPLN